MSPASGWVLGAAAAVTAAPLWQALVERSIGVDVALTRYLLAVVGCWLVLSVVSDLLPAGGRRSSEPSPADSPNPLVTDRPDPSEV